MSKMRGNSSQVTAWVEFNEEFTARVPHLAAWFGDTLAFVELRLMARDDGTTLAVAKGYDSDGGPVVCFGVGYGLVAAVMAIDATMNGGRWRVDTPWEAKKK